MNLTNTPKIIQEGTVIGNISPVDEVLETPVEEVCQQKEVPDHLKELYEDTIKSLAEGQVEVKKLLVKFATVFAKSDFDLGRTNIIKHTIETQHARPHREPPRRVPFHLQGDMDKAIDNMLAKDVIEPSTSPWSAGVVLVKKKDGSMRFCVDYRMLNAQTIRDAYPLPRVSECLDQLAGSSWFSTMDMCSGYWQQEIDIQDRPKTAFATRRGLFQFKVLPMGLCNSSGTFERLMETVLSGLQWKICLIYLDDIIVYAKTFDGMIENLSEVLEHLKQAGLKLKPKKCSLFAKEVEFLGHVVSADGVSTDPKKIDVVKDWQRPMNKSDVRSFLGFCSYYRRFIGNFSDIAKPLHRLTEKNKSFEWTDACQNSFDRLKQCLVSAPILAHPDFEAPFILDTDASGTAIGAVLSQIQNGHERVISYASRCLSKAETRYCVTRRELLAVVVFVKHFKHYLSGKKFVLRTDHGSLRWLMNFKNPEGQMARWLQELSSFDMDIQHRQGRKHTNADALSRLPCRQCTYCAERKVSEDKSLCSDSQNQLFRAYSGDDTELGNTLLIEMQDSDRAISTVKSWVEEGRKPEYKDITNEGYFLRSLWSQWNRLFVKNGILYREWKVVGTDLSQFQVVIPLKERRTVLRYCHDHKSSGHLGMKKTLGKVREKFYWPSLQNDVRAYVAGCEKCLMRKAPSRLKKAPMQIMHSGITMERIATDILGELPETDEGNRYILVISDYFTKWTEAFAMPNMEAKTVARIIVEEVIVRFGVPYTIHSDQGRQYESKLFAEVCKLLDIEKTRTTPYHPKSDGMVERFNRTLEAMLSNYVKENHKDWDRQLPYIMMAYRSAEHETTGFTPNMLMLGRETTVPLDLVYEMPSSMKTIPSNRWVWELQERLGQAHDLVRKYAEGNIIRQKAYHDRKVSWERFEIGDKVYVYFPLKKVGCSPKLTSFWRGPFEVKKKVSEVLYEINCGRNGTNSVIHCDRIRKKVEQRLSWEAEDNDRTESDDQDVVMTDDDVRDDITQQCSRPRREIKRPARFDDYECS